jgi:hypothetical protein
MIQSILQILDLKFLQNENSSRPGNLKQRLQLEDEASSIFLGHRVEAARFEFQGGRNERSFRHGQHRPEPFRHQVRSQERGTSAKRGTHLRQVRGRGQGHHQVSMSLNFFVFDVQRKY